MRVSPTPEQLDYLASLGVCVAVPPVRATGSRPRRKDETASSRRPPERLHIHAAVGVMGGFCGGVIGLLLGGFFGLVTHGLAWGICMAFCTAIGWFMLAFLWSFGWRSDADLGDEAQFSDAQFGIGVASGLAGIAFAVCFFGMIVGVMIWGPESAKAWVRGTLFVVWIGGLVPGVVFSVFRLIRARST